MTHLHCCATQHYWRCLFVIVHTFCASCTAWFKCHPHSVLSMMQSTTLLSTQLKWKQTFPTVTKSVKNYPFLLLSEICWCQQFCWDSRLIQKNAWLPQFFFVDSNNPCKDRLFLSGPNFAWEPLYLHQWSSVWQSIPSVNTRDQHFFDT